MTSEFRLGVVGRETSGKHRPNGRNGKFTVACGGMQLVYTIFATLPNKKPIHYVLTKREL